MEKIAVLGGARRKFYDYFKVPDWRKWHLENFYQFLRKKGKEWGHMTSVPPGGVDLVANKFE